jgi:hypothetical protein
MPTSGSEAGNESTGPPGAEELLRLGIEHHEAMRLTESAACFEAAARDGKSGVGMLLWGLSLRHGWGTPRDERAAFRWLEKAARLTTGELEGAGTKARRRESKVGLQKELVLAIYEVGQCFFQGWGTTKDKVLAVVRAALLHICCLFTDVPGAELLSQSRRARRPGRAAGAGILSRERKGHEEGP